VRQVEYYLSYVRYFRKHHGRAAAAILRAAVVLGTLTRMAALVVRYPPVDRQRAAMLSAREARARACCAPLAFVPDHARA